MILIDPGPITRDHYGRPMWNGKSWTRPSTLAKTLDDQTALAHWRARMAVLGLGRSADLVSLASTLDPDDRDKLNRLVEDALARAGHEAGANFGTAVHTATELHDHGHDIKHVTAELRQLVAGYDRLLADHRLAPAAAEIFVVSEQFGCAGTLDRLYTGPHRTVVGDLKSGKAISRQYANVAWAIQVAVYATGRPVVAGKLVDWEDVGLPTPSQDHGVVVHIPSDEPDKPVLCLVDLKLGRRLARLALDVRAARSQTPVTPLRVK